MSATEGSERETEHSKRTTVTLLTILSLLTFGIAAWIFFSVRPKVTETHQLQQQTSQLQQQLDKVQKENVELEATAKPIRGDVKQSRAYLHQGVTLFHAGQYGQAIDFYDKALTVYPEDPYGWSLKGYALFRAGRISESIDANKKAVQLDPGDPLNFIDLAKSYCAAKQFDDAQKALTKDPASDVVVQVRQYFKTDGEIRRVCAPIIKRVENS